MQEILVKFDFHGFAGERSVSVQYWKGLAKVAIAAVIWGAAYPLTKSALATVPPIVFGFMRFFMAGTILVVMTKGLPFTGVTPRDRSKMVWLGFWGSFVLVLGMNFGLRWAPGVAASIISGTPPLFTVFLAAWLLGEPLRKVHFIAVAAALLGLYFLAENTDAGNCDPEMIRIGCLLVIVPQIAWAIYGVLGKTIISKYPWPLVCRDTFVVGALLLAPFAFAEFWFSGLGVWNWRTVFVLVYLGTFNSVVTYGLWNSALGTIPVSTASFVLYVQPVSGAIISSWLFEERLGTTGFIGAALVFFALALVLSPGRSR